MFISLKQSSLLVTARLWGKFFWTKKHLKTTLFAKSKSDQEAPTRRLLRVWRLFLSSLSPSWLPSLPPSTSRCPRWRTELQDGILESSRGRFPRVFGDEFGDKFSDKFGDKFSDSPNLVTNVVTNLVTNLVNHQIYHQICHQIYHQIRHQIP